MYFVCVQNQIRHQLICGSGKAHEISVKEMVEKENSTEETTSAGKSFRLRETLSVYRKKRGVTKSGPGLFCVVCGIRQNTKFCLGCQKGQSESLEISNMGEGGYRKFCMRKRGRQKFL